MHVYPWLPESIRDRDIGEKTTKRLVGDPLHLVFHLAEEIQVAVIFEDHGFHAPVFPAFPVDSAPLSIPP